MSRAGKEVESSSTHNLAKVCVFGGINAENKEEFKKAARELGKELAKKHINVVYGGEIDLSNIVALNASMRGSDVLGVTLLNSVRANDVKFTVGAEYKAANVQERMECMLYNAHAIIALPGGLDTLKSFSTFALWAELNCHKKPLGLLNVDGFYDGLLAFLEHATEQGFIPQAAYRLITAAPQADQLIDQLQRLASAPVPTMDQMPDNKKDSRKRKEPDTDLRL